MPKYVAFLRAINVGGHNVKMDRLKGLFEEIRFSNVSTYIASGNVIFDSSSKNTEALEIKIEKHMRKSLSYDVSTFIRTMPELREMVDRADSLANDYRGKIHVAFLKGMLSASQRKKILVYRTDTDDFHFHRNELFWLCATPMMESSFSSALFEKTLGMPATFRNMNTVRKIISKYS